LSRSIQALRIVQEPLSGSADLIDLYFRAYRPLGDYFYRYRPGVKAYLKWLRHRDPTGSFIGFVQPCSSVLCKQLAAGARGVMRKPVPQLALTLTIQTCEENCDPKTVGLTPLTVNLLHTMTKDMERMSLARLPVETPAVCTLGLLLRLL
jgi:hypothetical protein